MINQMPTNKLTRPMVKAGRMLLAPSRRMLIIPSETDTMTKGGIHIPLSAQEPPTTGMVYDIGDSVSTSWYHGLTVMYNRLHAPAFEWEGIEYVSLDMEKHPPFAVLEYDMHAKFTIRPRSGYALIRRLSEPEMIGNIVVPSSCAPELTRGFLGMVVALDKDVIDSWIVVGDTVVSSPFGGEELELDGSVHYFMKILDDRKNDVESPLLGVLRNDS